MLDIFRRGEVLPEGRTNEEEVRLIAEGKPEPAPQPRPSRGLRKLGAVLSAPFPRRSAFPALKGTREGVGMLVTEEVGNRVEINGAVLDLGAGRGVLADGQKEPKGSFRNAGDAVHRTAFFPSAHPSEWLVLIRSVAISR